MNKLHNAHSLVNAALCAGGLNAGRKARKSCIFLSSLSTVESARCTLMRVAMSMPGKSPLSISADMGFGLPAFFWSAPGPAVARAMALCSIFTMSGLGAGGCWASGAAFLAALGACKALHNLLYLV